VEKPFTENRPWGLFRQFTHSETTTVKLLHIKAGQELSLQSHHLRKEFWHIISGTPTLTLGNKIIISKPGDEFIIEKETMHRIATTNTPAVVLEISYGDFDEDDIVRYQDKYGRVD